MARRVLASYATEEKLADLLNDFKTKGYTSKDFLIFTSESSLESIHTHTDDILERLPALRRSGGTGVLISEIKQSFSDGSNTTPPVVSLEKLNKLGVSNDQAAAYGSDADAGNILILVNDDPERNDASLNINPEEKVDRQVENNKEDDSK